MWFELFDGIFVINLPARADRRREIDQQLRRVGLSLTHERVVLFPAVRPDAPGGFPSIGARGCFMSHLGAMRMAQARGMGNILILEDDCDFSKEVDELLPRLSSALQSLDWALFYGGALNRFEAQTAVPGLQSVQASSGLMGSHCIALRAKVVPVVAAYFDAMLQRPPGSEEGGPMHVDGAYSWFRKDHPELTTLMAEPELAFQRSSATDIHDKRWFDRWPVLRHASTLARRCRNWWRTKEFA
ncbi:glycosyltransferase family 25 protein [Aquabacterium sp. A08]|uniref:glycosyltransferase family 25 protein n=1 Tax=Aquabacterium sp. A08 TaxID=2718532 RepID=UPI0014227D00|nr:glycosyltransferase family 25 protein [Aquabacterium sp. A08]NIC41040.1 glycosyltransferase family 25 protein [Aquabacterium sp. A08]